MISHFSEGWRCFEVVLQLWTGSRRRGGINLQLPSTLDSFSHKTWIKVTPDFNWADLSFGHFVLYLTSVRVFKLWCSIPHPWRRSIHTHWLLVIPIPLNAPRFYIPLWRVSSTTEWKFWAGNFKAKKEIYAKFLPNIRKFPSPHFFLKNRIPEEKHFFQLCSSMCISCSF